MIDGRTPCASRCVDGMVRGGIVGVAWGAVVGGYDGYASSGRLGVSTARVAGRAVLTSSVSFASFLGCYSGTSCLAERLRGRDDWVSRCRFGGRKHCTRTIPG